MFSGVAERMQSFRDGPKDQTRMCNLHIGESLDSRFAASRRPGTTMRHLPVAVESIVAIVIAAAPIATVVDAEYALHGAHRAADAGPDCSADDTADRAGNPVSFVGAFPRAAHDALRVPDMRDREQCKHHGSNGEMECCG